MTLFHCRFGLRATMGVLASLLLTATPGCSVMVEGNDAAQLQQYRHVIASQMDKYSSINRAGQHECSPSVRARGCASAVFSYCDMLTGFRRAVADVSPPPIFREDHKMLQEALQGFMVSCDRAKAAFSGNSESQATQIIEEFRRSHETLNRIAYRIVSVGGEAR